MTTMEVSTSQFDTSKTAWLDSVSAGATEVMPKISRFGSWVTHLVYGHEAPTEATYTRFSGQESQVPTFIDLHSFSVGDNITLGEE